MGIFRERRTSLPAMVIKDNSETSKDKKEVFSAELDSEYVNKMSTASGIKITSSFENSKLQGLEISQAHSQDSESKLSCIVRLEPDSRDESLYCIRMVTNLEFFQLKRSCSYRQVIIHNNFLLILTADTLLINPNDAGGRFSPYFFQMTT